MSTRKADPRAARPAPPKRAGGDPPPPTDDASGIEGLFVDDLPRPAPRPRRKGSKDVSDKSAKARDKEKPRSGKVDASAQRDARPDNGDSKEKRKNARAAERRRERGEAPGSVDGAPTSASLKREAEPATPATTGFHTTGASGKLAYAVGVLQCEKGPEEGLSLKLLEGDYTIGRARENSFVLKDIAASREHLRVRVQGNTCIAIDQGSGNGTKVNGARISEHVLKDGDKIEIGNSVLVYKHVGGEESKSSRGVRVGTNPGVQRAATQERIVMAAERLAAELSERFRREEDDGLDDDPATNLERQGRARLAEKRNDAASPKPSSRPQLSVVDNSEIALEVRQMVEQVSKPDLARAVPPDMWGDSETETRFPSENVAASPSMSELARAPTRPPMPKADIAPLLANTQRRATPPPLPQKSSPSSSSVEPTPSAGAGFPAIQSGRLPSRMPPGDGTSYVHKTRAVAQKERSRSVVLLTAIFVVLTLGISLGIAWVVFVDGNPRALFGADRTEDAPPSTATSGDGQAGANAGAASDAPKATDTKPENAAASTTTDDKTAADKAAAAAEKAAAEKSAADKTAADKTAADKSAADRSAAEKSAADKSAAAEKAAAEKSAADKAAADKAAAEKRDAEKRETEKRDAEKRDADARAAKKAEPRVEKKDPPRKETRREPVKERAEPKPEPAKPKPAAKSMDDAQAKSLVQQAVAGLKNDDYDEACPLLARVAKDAPDGSTWKVKAQNLQRARCQ
jgi:pSer/pThr/pTyr-binding forkhead associated (FHA) protein